MTHLSDNLSHKACKLPSSEKKTLDLGLGDMKLVEEATDARKKILQLTLSRHQRGLMHPWVNHVIANKEVKIQAVMEDSST